jgi:NodT family efflux transporter outer membrane factor (OMF) lipoprotein
MNYVELRSYQARLQVAEANLASQEETWEITRWRQEAGLTTALDVELARTNLEQTRANIPALRSGIQQSLNALSVLVGGVPGTLDAELGEYRGMPMPPDEIAVGIPADILRRRPDLRRAERELAAQSAQIGVAKSKLFPSFSLSGSVGLDALSAEDLLDTDAFSTGADGLISWPVYKAGSIVRNIELQWEVQGQKLIAYRKALLTALEDVENGLTSYAHEKESRESLLAAYQAAELAVEMSRVQYGSGLVDFTTVLDSGRTLLSLQNQLTQSDAQIIKNLIALYKALGGGWESS